MPNLLLRWFDGNHLKTREQRELVISFQRLALVIDNNLPDSPEKTTALRKLLEAKDCVVRGTILAEEARRT